MIKPYYQSDSVTIYHGDCLQILPELIAKGLKVDHVITDPPYEAEAHTKQRRLKLGKQTLNDLDRLVKEGKGPKYTPIEEFDPITDAERDSFGALIAKMTLRWCLTFCQVEASQKWAVSYNQMTYKRTCIWVKPGGQPNYSGDKPGMGYETILVMHAAGVGKSRWNGGGRVGVFRHASPKRASHPIHPTTKPMSLMLELVRLFTDPGDLILDPYTGSGTTLRAAQTLGRKAIGIEINEKYAELAARRCEALSDKFRDSSKHADALAERGYNALL